MCTENVFGGLDHIAHYGALRLDHKNHGFVSAILAMAFLSSVWILLSGATAVPNGAVEVAENVSRSICEKFPGTQGKKKKKSNNNPPPPAHQKTLNERGEEERRFCRRGTLCRSCVSRWRQELVPLELLLLMNSQAGRVAKCAFSVSYSKRIPPCTYNKTLLHHLKKNRNYFSMAEVGYDLAVTSASFFMTPSLLSTS